MTAIDTLKALGFNEEETKEFQQISDDLDLSRDDNPHKVLAVLVKDDVTAVIEKNVSEDEAGGVVSITKHPAVLILESKSGRVCISNFDDADNQAMVEQAVSDLS